MVRGRKPLPTQWHVINGNPSKKNLNTDEPKPKPISPTCPTWLKAEAKKLWKDLMPELERLGLMTIVDGGAFAAACQNWAVYVECERYFKAIDPATVDPDAKGKHKGSPRGRTYEYTNKNGSTNEMARPEVAIGQRALADFKAFCAEFGLTPASRVRLGSKPVSPEDDPMEALLRKSGG